MVLIAVIIVATPCNEHSWDNDFEANESMDPVSMSSKPRPYRPDDNNNRFGNNFDRR
jgi:hypothetical protein